MPTQDNAQNNTQLSPDKYKESIKNEELAAKQSPLLTIIELSITNTKDEAMTFKKAIERKYNIEGTDEEVFEEYSKRFHKELDTDAFKQTIPGSKKGISIEKIRNGLIKHGDHITLHKDELVNRIVYNPSLYVIEGKFIGGTSGRKRSAKQLLDKNKNKDILDSDVVSDEYYALLYLPMDDNKGFLLIQYYPDATIKNELIEFINSTLTSLRCGYKLNHGPYYNNEFKEAFEEDAVLDHITLRTVFPDGDDVGDGSASTEVPVKGIKLKIEVSELGDTPTPSGMVEGVYKKIKGIFSNNKELEKFADKSVTVKKLSSKAQKTFKIGDDLKIEPIISLYGKIEIKKGIPNFTELKKYMHEMLESVKKGTLLGYGDIQDE